jgi:hypothetical protein
LLWNFFQPSVIASFFCADDDDDDVKDSFYEELERVFE